MKPKFSMTQEEMEYLVEDCDNAIGECPQGFYDMFSNRYEDVKKLHKGKLDPVYLMNHYKNSCLFGYGYSQYLNDDTLELFDKYDEYLVSMKRWRRENDI